MSDCDATVVKNCGGAGRFFSIAATITLLAGMLALFVVPAAPAGAAENEAFEIPTTDGLPSKAYFPETGHHLAGEFLNRWLNDGSFTIYGFPITDPVSENGRIVQYFERARLELWPENSDSEWVVQGTLLGNWKAEQSRQLSSFQPVVVKDYKPNPDVYYFDETKHTLANGFKKYWDEHGGVQVFGFPISEEFEEDGNNVQYFERARMEWHPENAGTDYEILLGQLGKEYAEQHHVSLKEVGIAADAVNYDAGVFDTHWKTALNNGAEGRWAKVEVDALNVRAEPTFDATVLDVVYSRRPLQLERMVKGDEEKGVGAWYELSTGGYVPAVYVDPLNVTPPPETFGGAWVDINLSNFYAIVYQGNTPVYAAIITAGRGDRTPKGVFNVQYRVENETMDSATVGIPLGDPEYYYLENVLYTQYFHAGGFAVHGNYWTPEASFGRFSSNGCVGLMNSDAAFFWNWLGVGSVVSIHF